MFCLTQGAGKNERDSFTYQGGDSDGNRYAVEGKAQLMAMICTVEIQLVTRQSCENEIKLIISFYDNVLLDMLNMRTQRDQFSTWPTSEITAEGEAGTEITQRHVVRTETGALGSYGMCGSLEGKFHDQFDLSFSLSTRHKELVRIQRVKVS